MKRRTFLKSILGAAAMLLAPISRLRAKHWRPSITEPSFESEHHWIHLIRDSADSMAVDLMNLHQRVVVDETGREILVDSFASIKVGEANWRHHVILLPAAPQQSWSEMKIYDAMSDGCRFKTFKIRDLIGTAAHRFAGWRRVSEAEAQAFVASHHFRMGMSARDEYSVTGV